MKRYVKEVANDCLRELDELERFTISVAQYCKQFSPEKLNEICAEYDAKREQIRNIVQQCKLGYIPDLKAVEQIAGV